MPRVPENQDERRFQLRADFHLPSPIFMRGKWLVAASQFCERYGPRNGLRTALFLRVSCSADDFSINQLY